MWLRTVASVSFNVWAISAVLWPWDKCASTKRCMLDKFDNGWRAGCSTVKSEADGTGHVNAWVNKLSNSANSCELWTDLRKYTTLLARQNWAMSSSSTAEMTANGSLAQ